MEDSVSSAPCLESSTGERIRLAGNCSFGRLSENTIKIASERASRRHATIHGQDAGEFWLIDLGSVNGTHVNGRRVSLPTRLQDGDRIAIAGHEFVYHAGTYNVVETESMCDATVMMSPEIRNEPCWLLLGDVEQFTQLSQRVNPETLAMMMGRWIRSSKTVVEESGGTMNKYLGDGYLAFWRGKDEVAGRVVAAAQSFKRLQTGAEPPFRIVIHHGLVTIGGAATLGEESLMGPEVNFVFRMEKFAGSASVRLCLSSKANDILAPLLSTTPIPGEHELRGFAGMHRFFQVQ